jgi:UTP--glucose-1-phosphate uridylyltransferase
MLPAAGATSFTRQQAPLGLGHAVWCARDIVGDEPFALLLPDMVMRDSVGCLSGMVRSLREGRRQHCRGRECDPALAHKVRHRRQGRGRWMAAFRITEMVEKPAEGHGSIELLHQRPLHPAAGDLRTILAKQERGAGNEIQVTDAMLKLAESSLSPPIHFGGETYDCGSKAGFILANVAYALDRPDIKPTWWRRIEGLIARA